MKFRSAPPVAALAVVAATLAFAGPATAQTTGSATARVLELEDEIRRLNGRIEELEFRLRQVVEDATRRFGDIEYRMTVLEGGDASLLGDPVPLGQTGGGDAPSGPVAAISERATLDEAIAVVDGGDHERGRRMLEDFMVAYPNGPLVGEAEHWLGESYFRDERYRSAAATFLTNVSDREEHPLTSKSFHRLAASLARLGHVGEACQTYREILRRQPGDAAVVENVEAERRRLDCP